MTTLLPAPLQTDLPCLRCGYNLRALPATAACPECNLPITASQAYAAANPSVIRHPTRLLIACLLLAANNLLYLLPTVFNLVISLLHTPYNSAHYFFIQGLTGLAAVLSLLPAILLLFNAGLPPKPVAFPLRYFWLSIALLHTLLLFCSTALLLYEAWIVSFSPPFTSAALFNARALIHLASGITFIIVIMGGWRFFSSLAHATRKPMLFWLTSALATLTALGTLCSLAFSTYVYLARFSLAPLSPLLRYGLLATTVLLLLTHVATAFVLCPILAHLALQSRPRPDQN